MAEGGAKAQIRKTLRTAFQRHCERLRPVNTYLGSTSSPVRIETAQTIVRILPNPEVSLQAKKFLPYRFHPCEYIRGGPDSLLTGSNKQ